MLRCIPNLVLIGPAMAIAMLSVLPSPFAWAQAQPGGPPSASQILDALKGKRQRGVTAAERSHEDHQKKLIDALKAKAARGLSDQERVQLAAIAKERPSVDLVIYFDFNSAEINARALATLASLGQALKSTELNDGTFLVAGHTDAKGPPDYNRSLSERRAQAVKLFLSQKFGISESQLLAVGYGKEQPRKSREPRSRREPPCTSSKPWQIRP